MIEPTIHNTLGVLYLGGVIIAFLFGVSFMQAIRYFSHSARDSIYIKGTVAFLWTLNVLHLVFACREIYYYAVSNFGQLDKLAKITWSGVAIIVISVNCDTITRGIFSIRVWKFSNHNHMLLIIITLCSWAAYGVTIALAVRCAQTLIYADFNKLEPLVFTCLGLLVLSDTLIALCLCLYLYMRKPTTRRTQSVVHILAAYAINTGALTSVCAIITLCTYAISPSTMAYQLPYLLIPKLYFISLLANLNARDNIKAKMGGIHTHISVPLVSIDRIMPSTTICSPEENHEAGNITQCGREMDFCSKTSEGKVDPSVDSYKVDAC